MKRMKIKNYLPMLVLALLAACDNAPVPEQAVTAEGGSSAGGESRPGIARARRKSRLANPPLGLTPSLST